LGRRRWRRFQEDTMTFFNAYRAVDVNVPIYFIESTAPNNVDDTDEISMPSLPHLEPIPNSDDAVRQIAEDLAKGAEPNLVVMVVQQSAGGGAEDLYGRGAGGEQG
jgi:hypothetical protein